MRLLACLVLSILAASGSAATPHAAKEAHASADPKHWTYEGGTGPGYWADMDPANALCRSGQQQSPIDISVTYGQKLEPLSLRYLPGLISTVNNGHTIQHNIEPGSFLEIGGDRYQLLQFHFHSPSEEAVAGRRYPMVAHFVHKNDAGQLAVIAVFLKEGKEDQRLIRSLWKKLPAANETTRDEHLMLNPQALMPGNLAYWTLMGSLTTPPCSEGVRWLILKTPITLSARQLAQFRKIYPMNARPIQPLHQRAILDAQGSW
ncbi:carbonic anhydrase [Andreprevotia sp. IGB-42]|uniref:carbonic anhydrase n=1 Tax=Andreprevotia sp. IGB-42 TaxID=2497473 RepID=UPI001358D035|nr:carbonic anhydrase family protein [Andreprevotia sp. IGB-42]